MRRRIAALFAVVLASCSSNHQPGQISAPPAALILISIDTLRPDRLGTYGDPSAHTPTIDRLARDGVRFEDAIAHAPSTLASHASLLSSLLPQQHGASYATRQPLDNAVTTLAETVQQAGWRTGAFTGNGQLSSEFQLGQGFEVYRDGGGTLHKKVRQAFRWIDSLDNEPFFLFLHTYEVHHPYRLTPTSSTMDDGESRSSLPDEISVDLLRQINAGAVQVGPEDLAHIERAYAAGIARMDQGLRKLVKGLVQRRLYDRALIVLTSDHGEEFGEHGSIGWHSHTLHDELLRVPLIFKLPKQQSAGSSIENQVRLVDVAPTILESIAIEPPKSFVGTSLLQTLITGRNAPSRLPAVSLLDTPERNVQSIRLADWKWIAGRLYHLGEDPGEHDDLSRLRSDVAARLETTLLSQISSRRRHSARPVLPDDATVKDLESLGYL